jgi:hypothetical protein
MDLKINMYNEQVDNIMFYFLTIATIDNEKELFTDYQIYTFLGIEEKLYNKYMLDLGAKKLLCDIVFDDKTLATNAKKWLEEHLEGFLIAKELTK